uniref:Leucine-rich repeat-containing N-terminal plant-type domain-containing protein n=1 Tax=Leptocylindrus danicus TaxID=163516 RepID=A0A7S2KKT3_9STRA|mmetsp:Transcript_23690/g.35563  ORF Transcript_23690/g.35563 Transcript_23690/m.35563 type:complete len:469 (+) Transcript_23690:180-1586(+)
MNKQNMRPCTTDAEALQGLLGHSREFDIYNSNKEACEYSDIIKCGSNGEVIEVTLNDAHLSDELSPALGCLRELKRLQLRGNFITGAIPQEVASLPNLEVLDLSDNKLSGELPRFTSDQLRSLLLKKNNLSGSLSSDFLTSPHQLEWLDLGSNQFTGPIPSDVQWTGLKFLELSNNEFSGPIPESLNIAQSLVIARLNGNNLSGGIPESLFDGMSTNTLEHQNIEEKPFMNLVEFRVHGNELSGPIPKELCDILEAYTTRSTDSCDHVACAEGTYNEFGYATKSAPCMPCDMLRTVSDDVPVMYLGSTSCNVESSEFYVLEMAETETEADDMKLGLGITLGALCSVLVALGAIALYLKMSQREEEVPYYADSYPKQKSKKEKRDDSIRRESSLTRNIRKSFSFRASLIDNSFDNKGGGSGRATYDSKLDDVAESKQEVPNSPGSPNSSITTVSSGGLRKEVWVDVPRI